jgi:uncharacterized SAM-binding protein YcdF (DUF218 family)
VSQVLLRVLGAVAIGLVLVVGFTPALGLVRPTLSPHRQAEQAQAIVVLGAGGVARGGGLTDTSLRAAMEGLTLFREGWAPVLVFSGGVDSQRRAEAEVRAAFARACGVPAAAIVTLGTAHSTHEEALRSQALLQPRGIRKILLVGDAPGMVRAMAVFERVGFEVVPAPWNRGAWDLRASPEDRLGLLREIAMEVVARLYYHAMGYL